MPVEIKFCGLTRASDAALGAALGASYLGVIFASSPRHVDAVAAQAVFGSLPRGPKKVGVFGPTAPGEIARMADRLSLDVVQMHGDPRASDVESLRHDFPGEIWASRRIGRELPQDLDELAGVADRVLLDARRADGEPLGGGGRSFEWELIAPKLGRHLRLVIAGGLTPENVGWAIDLFAPDVVDVSSGIEQSPGIKDEALMRAFVREVRGKDT